MQNDDKATERFKTLKSAENYKIYLNLKICKTKLSIKDLVSFFARTQECTIITMWVRLSVQFVPSGIGYWLIYIHHGSCTLQSVDQV